jgi:hypothetical protein
MKRRVSLSAQSTSREFLGGHFSAKVIAWQDKFNGQTQGAEDVAEPTSFRLTVRRGFD